ncbi:hypothetical protein CFT12S00416_07835 [Campylobacter fetus subsp. testudinum]|uniref:zeta toxin family protein n=1 Tax=Campylobacter fetus TaxID=196 RepID=UPI00081890CC|nr:zeta toxin family protein [Campylobacter fetus]OCR87729.1 hypothetical protein CFT12S00416_07835 [Campylobacter fetus subsp. testudinum]
MAELHIIAGANGSGKSSFGSWFAKISNMPFIDTDLYYKNKYGDYREYSQYELISTSQELQGLREQYFKGNQSFAIEKILNNLNSLKKIIGRAKDYGFIVCLDYIGTDNIDINISRIDKRFKNGLHNVDVDLVKENFLSCKKNVKEIACLCDEVSFYDNSRNKNTKFEKYYKGIVNAELIYAEINHDKDTAFITTEPLPDWFKEISYHIDSSALDDIKAEMKQNNTDLRRNR